jgi:PPP family 3-phenylpropionic acid transporter
MRAPVLLAAFWFLLLGGLGTFYPFFSLYLVQTAGLDGAQAGVVLAMLPLVGLVAQPLWGQLADRSGARAGVLALLAAGSAAGYVLLFFARGFGALLAATAALATFSSPLIPMCVAVSFAVLARHGAHAFGIVRAFGTVGYLVAVVAFPALAARWDTTAEAVTSAAAAPMAGGGLALMMPLSALCCAAAAVVATRLHSSAAGRGTSAAAGEWRLLARNREFTRVLAFTFAAYLFLHGPMIFFPVFVRSIGGTLETVGDMWVVMLALEIPLVALSGAGFARFGARTLLAAGAAAGALRWLVCGWSQTPALITAVQVLHGVTVVGFMVGAPMYADAVVPARLRATAQGALSMVGVGVGGVASSVLAGWLVDAFGAAAPARVGGAGALLLTAAVATLVPPPKRGLSTGTADAAPMLDQDIV